MYAGGCFSQMVQHLHCMPHLVLVRWYTSLLGKMSSLAALVAAIKEKGVSILPDFSVSASSSLVLMRFGTGTTD
jgi:hypothetical protein